MTDLRESLAVAAPAEVVYALVADLPRMGEWSPECERVTWLGGATAAAEGAKFLGHNRVGWVRWMTQGQVVAAEPGRRLAFEITFGLLKVARWEYLIAPDVNDPSSCTVVEEWTDRRPLWFRTPAERTFGPRMKTNHRGMVQTLANLKIAAEAATTGGAPANPVTS
jgi:uncharacterized protein YndB with AHSA1/START domain